MTNQTNGGASVGGDVNAQGDAVLRDKNIYYIAVVGNLLSWAQVEGMLPQIRGNDFSNIANTIENALSTHLKEDLVKATAFAGEILSEFVEAWLVQYSGKPIPLAELVASLIDHVGHKLERNGYWEAYTQRTYNGKAGRLVLKLDATTMLHARRTGNSALDFGIVYGDIAGNNRYYHLVRATFSLDKQVYSSSHPKQYDGNMLRMFITGIVLDLIRIYSDNTISVQFLQELSNMLKSRQD